MDPLAVLRTIWRQKWFALPAIALAVGAAIFVYAEGPREYEATLSYAVANPQVPTDDELRADPALKLLNNDNPYLRSSDPNLVASVVMTRLNAPETGDTLESMGLSTDYTAAPGVGGSGLVVAITATGASPHQSLATLTQLGLMFDEYLYDIQKVNGADDRYLFTPILVAAPDRATEKLSSRLRTVIIVGVCGMVLIFTAISLGTWVDSRKQARNERTAVVIGTDGPAPEPAASPRDVKRQHYRTAAAAPGETLNSSPPPHVRAPRHGARERRQSDA